MPRASCPRVPCCTGIPIFRGTGTAPPQLASLRDTSQRTLQLHPTWSSHKAGQPRVSIPPALYSSFLGCPAFGSLEVPASTRDHSVLPHMMGSTGMAATLVGPGRLLHSAICSRRVYAVAEKFTVQPLQMTASSLRVSTARRLDAWGSTLSQCGVFSACRCRFSSCLAPAGISSGAIAAPSAEIVEHFPAAQDAKGPLPATGSGRPDLHTQIVQTDEGRAGKAGSAEGSATADGLTSTECDTPRDLHDEPAANQQQLMGAFYQIPDILPAEEILTMALNRAHQVGATSDFADSEQSERNRGASQIDTLTKELTSPLVEYVMSFPRPSHLHPYERAVLELTLGQGGYEEALGSVDCLRKRLLDVGRSCMSLLNETTTKEDAAEQTDKAIAHLQQLFVKRSHVVDSLKGVATILRNLPVMRHDIPTLCLVGAPNAGKSSLVQAISPGALEVYNYPFTARGFEMGHFFVGPKRHQITDTPGLLARPDEERNNTELLTIATLAHLPTAVLFVHDLTEGCGTSLEDQYQLYCEMKERFGHRPWIDVLSKAELLDLPVRDGVIRNASSNGVQPEQDLPFEVYKKMGPQGAIPVSTVQGQGIKTLLEKVASVLSEIESMDSAMDLSDKVSHLGNHKQAEDDSHRTASPAGGRI